MIIFLFLNNLYKKHSYSKICYPKRKRINNISQDNSSFESMDSVGANIGEENDDSDIEMVDLSHVPLDAPYRHCGEYDEHNE